MPDSYSTTSSVFRTRTHVLVGASALVGRDRRVGHDRQALDGADDLLHAEAAEGADALFGPCALGTTSGRLFASSCDTSHAQRRGCITITFGAANRVA
jgi:hypothetical protein